MNDCSADGGGIGPAGRRISIMNVTSTISVVAVHPVVQGDTLNLVSLDMSKHLDVD